MITREHRGDNYGTHHPEEARHDREGVITREHRGDNYGTHHAEEARHDRKGYVLHLGGSRGTGY